MILGLAVLALPGGIARDPSGHTVCCPPRDVRFSARQMKARLRHTMPVLPPGLGKDVRVEGNVVFVVGFDTRGDVVCIRSISGHPLLVASAIDSLKHWKFQAGPEPICGRLVLSLSTLKPDMGLQILETEPSSPQRRP
jgi:hypothetical protein